MPTKLPPNLPRPRYSQSLPWARLGPVIVIVLSLRVHTFVHSTEEEGDQGNTDNEATDRP